MLTHLHGRTNLWGSRGSSSVLMTTPHWPLQRKQMEPQGDVSISLTTWVSSGKGTDVAPRMKKGWGAGQGHHTPRLGSDKHGWLGVFTCPRAIKGRRGQGLKSYGSSVIPLRAWGVGEGRGIEVQHSHMPGLYSRSELLLEEYLQNS